MITKFIDFDPQSILGYILSTLEKSLEKLDLT